MNDADVECYIPWAEDALLPGESPYALLNKLAWFACRGPVQLMRDLRATEGTPYPNSPSKIDFSTSAEEWSLKANARMWPIKAGRLREYFDRTRFDVLKEYSYSSYESEFLRFCPECVAVGMHFTITQLLLVENCPYHHRRLISCCPECGERIGYRSGVLNDAFGCRECGRSLLEAGLTDIRVNRRYRWRVSRSHVKLAKTLKSAPMIHCPVKGFRDSVVPYHGLKEAMTPLLHPDRPSSERSPSTSHYVIVKVGRNERGQPCIQPVSRLEPFEPPLTPSPLDDGQFHAVAQMRAGAWALQTYRDHRACICAAREAMKCSRHSRFARSERPLICCVGKGFAVWEAGRNERERKQLSNDLWEAWELGDAREKAFASYVLEKASLSGTIMAFLRSESLLLSPWENRDLMSDFSCWNTTSRQGEQQAILWQDLRHIDVSDACDLSSYDEPARWTWLESVCADLQGNSKGELEGQMRAHLAIDSLTNDYAAHQRALLTMPTLRPRMDGCGAAVW